jgi:iron complex transport system substrate-binding protein
LVVVAVGGCAGVDPAPAGGLPRRIISLSPSVTEILSGIGVFDRVIGVSRYCVLPPGAPRLPRVGGWEDVDIEQVVGLEPDLVAMTDFQAPLVQEPLQALGIRTLVVPSRSLDDIARAIRAIGDATGASREAGRRAREMRAALDAVRTRVSARERPRVLLIADRVPGTLRGLYTVTEGGFLEELVRIAGGEPLRVVHGIGGYARLDKEAIVRFDPEVVIDIVAVPPETAGGVWLRELPELTAVRNGRVHAITDLTVVHPSPVVAATARRLARIIHPEVFERER